MNTDTGESQPREGDKDGAIQRIAGRVVQLVATRLELFALELDEERRATTRLLLLLVGGGILALLGLVLLTFAGILALDPAWRPLGALVAALLYSGASAALFVRARRILRERPPPFAATIGELKRDREWLTNLK